MIENADAAWLSTLSVLYVEDDGSTRHFCSTFLRRRVGRLLVAADAVEGLAAFQAERPALVVTDIQMPGMDGLAMAEAMRRLDPKLRVVVTTAFEQVDYLQRAIAIGIDAFVMKPVSADILEKELQSCARSLRADALFAADQRRTLERQKDHEREALATLVGGMAHDFNNLLQVILGNIDLVSASALDANTREAIDAALEATQQAAGLGRHLRVLSEACNVPLAVRDVGPALRRGVLAGLAGARTEPSFDLDGALPAVAHDCESLAQAFSYLARNAREAMNDEGTLAISASVRRLGEREVAALSAGAYLEIRFKDEGRGIAPESLPKIFDPYYTTKERGAQRGLGLGLSLALATLRKQGGTVVAEPSSGAGATFTVLLPVAGADPPEPVRCA